MCVLKYPPTKLLPKHKAMVQPTPQGRATKHAVWLNEYVNTIMESPINGIVLLQKEPRNNRKLLNYFKYQLNEFHCNC